MISQLALIDAHQSTAGLLQKHRVKTFAIHLLLLQRSKYLIAFDEVSIAKTIIDFSMTRSIRVFFFLAVSTHIKLLSSLTFRVLVIIK